VARASFQTRTRVPFLDLAAIHAPLRERLLKEIGRLIDSNAFTNGPEVAEFEAAFAGYCGTRHCVGLSSGLDALRLGLIAAGMEPGDEVLVPANTFMASFEAITQAGGRPVPVDISEDDWNLDVALAADAVGERTSFVMPVHLYGQLTDMRALTAFASEHGLAIVEDACQAHGASREGIGAGAAGLAGAFSFYPGKNLGAFGDAGALVTDDAELAGRVRTLREHGQRSKYLHEREGWTARLDTIQALVLLHKLPFLDGWNLERRTLAQAYHDRLEGVGDLTLPPVAPQSTPVWHLYVVRTEDPAGLADFLSEHGVGTGRHYPGPPHLSQAYRGLRYEEGAFPVSEALARECLSLPIFPGMSEEQMSAVIQVVNAYFARG
jgi:dTDP-3-amino-3,4,6-trideoxy-alpha-D-glucose transaminase